jgi:hypothetical protein
MCGSPVGETDVDDPASVSCSGCGGFVAHLDEKVRQWVAHVASLVGVKSITLHKRGHFPTIEIDQTRNEDQL